MAQSYDSWRVSGYKHICGICGKPWWDSDGGCSCTDDMDEEEVEEAKKDRIAKLEARAEMQWDIDYET